MPLDVGWGMRWHGHPGHGPTGFMRVSSRHAAVVGKVGTIKNGVGANGLFLKGQITESTTPVPSSARELVIRDDRDTGQEVKIIIDANGNMKLRGKVYTEQ